MKQHVRIFVLFYLLVVALNAQVLYKSLNSLRQAKLGTTTVCPYGSVALEQPAGTTCESCGSTNFTTNVKIINGIESVRYSLPSQVYIMNYVFGYVILGNEQVLLNLVFSCGGTIINRFTILTAAHCITQKFIYEYKGLSYTITLNNPFDTGMYSVYVGAHNVSSLNTGSAPVWPTVKMGLKKMILHPQYDSQNALNDLALLITDSPIDFNQYVQSACLPDSTWGVTSYPLVNTPVIASGWGLLQSKGATTNTLQNVALVVYSSDKCSYGTWLRNWNSQICAGDINGVKAVCNGDSGGPLMVYDSINRKHVVSGIVSNGVIGCVKAGYASVFTRVSFFYDWIVQNWEKNCGTCTGTTTKTTMTTSTTTATTTRATTTTATTTRATTTRATTTTATTTTATIKTKTTTSTVTCFATDNFVTLYNRTKMIIDIQVGDMVKAVDQNGVVLDSQVIAIIHKDSQEIANFLNFKSASGDTISLTPSHLIYIKNKGYIRAELAKKGDTMIVYSSETKELKETEIIEIEEEMKKGYIAPLTETGTILVNNVHASCYAEVNSQWIADLAMKPVKLWYQVSKYFRSSTPSEEDGFHLYSLMLREFALNFLPSLFTY